MAQETGSHVELHKEVTRMKERLRSLAVLFLPLAIVVMTAAPRIRV